MILGAIIGATGAGKTKFACEMANQLDAEIISVDSRQVYQNLIIGTAQASFLENDIAKHHLQNFLPISQQYSLGNFIKDATKIISENPNQNYLLVGGTGFYLKGLMEGMASIVKPDAKLRKELEERLSVHGINDLLDELKSLDLIGFGKIDKNNPLRVLRALEVCKITGEPWSSALDSKNGGLGKFPLIWINPDRSSLYDNINRRVEDMFEQGWVAEVEHTIYKGAQISDPGMQSLGYREICLHLDGKISYNDMLSQIKQKTRKYAKRQLTYFRNQFNDYEVKEILPSKD